MQASDLFDFPENIPFDDVFRPELPPWQWIALIGEALSRIDFSRFPGHEDIPPGVSISGKVYIHPTVKLPPRAVIQGPAWIGKGTEIRPNAYIRGNVIVGENCVLGNSCEFKNCLLLNGVQAPHFNYVGDSILGNKSHLGAGVILANLRLDQKEVWVITPDGRKPSGLRKMGALLGDGAEVGCNAVLQPGTILDRRSVVMPTLAFGGYLEPETMACVRTEIKKLRRPS